MRILKDKKGLTPAVAVALLIVITVAVVAGIGYVVTSITSTPKEAPKGVFSVEISKTGGMNGYVHIREVSGDPIPTSDLKIVFEVKGVRREVTPNQIYAFYAFGSVRGSKAEASGTGNQTINVNCKFETATENITMSEILVRIYNETGNALLKEGYTDVNGKLTWTGPAVNFTSGTKYNVTLVGVDANGELADTTAGYSFTAGSDIRVINVEVVVEAGTSGYYYAVPWKFVPGEMPSTHPEYWFGNYNFNPGTTAAGDCVANWGITYIWDDIHALFHNWDDIDQGDPVEVTIVYEPLNLVIWKGTVMVR
ncbi:type IV pilin N-terminal domain-containing protein [Candidatus Bathyarchaeota archaeon]|nr:type IV pilin N-terminal domain-containing protein [Candidatus Bathyarchaeota archaeon]